MSLPLVTRCDGPLWSRDSCSLYSPVVIFHNLMSFGLVREREISHSLMRLST